MRQTALTTVTLLLLVFVDLDSSFASKNETLGQPRVALTSFKRLERRKELKCGRALNNFDQRIVGGKVASIVEFP